MGLFDSFFSGRKQSSQSGMAPDLASYITEFGLNEHRAYLLKIARPSIEIINTDAPISIGCSKFGGSPDRPPGFEWPNEAMLAS